MFHNMEDILNLTLVDNLKTISEIVIENKNYRSERINN